MTGIQSNLPMDIAAKVMFDSDRTCCICQERGKAIQIHHIDGNHGNNLLENLVVLCLECHNGTQLRGGFGRQLNPDVVIKYKNDWVERVEKRRNQADQMAHRRQVDEFILSENDEQRIEAEFNHEPPLSYINSLPAFKKELLRHMQPEWDSGVTARMVQASYEYIDALSGILVALATYYSDTQFAGKLPREYFADVISSRFEWHRLHAEPHGPGTGGTIVNIICCDKVMTDVENMIEDMVMSLVCYNDKFDWKGWPLRWKERNSKK